MVTLTVLYGMPDDPAAFEAYYANHHMPLVAKIPGTGRSPRRRGPWGHPTGSAAYHRNFTAWFDSREDLEAALATPEGRVVAADVPNFATGGATMFVAEVDSA